MAKLPPPLIGGVIPAFYSTNNEKQGGAVLTVPFSMNRAVSYLQVKGFVLKMKTIQSSTYLFTAESIREDTAEKIDDDSEINFYLTSAELDKLNIGQSYKCQIAYKDLQGNIGHYSTVGVVKFTTKPEVLIEDLVAGKTNMHTYEYLGSYSQENLDITERVNFYRFDLWDENDKLVLTSGDMAHNDFDEDLLYKSFDNFILAKDLDLDQAYYLQYTITTNNNIVVSSPRYKIMQKLSIDPEISAEVKATLNFNNGYIDVQLIGAKNEDGLEEPVTGAFLLTRASEDTNFSVWNEISRFKLAGQTPSRNLWRDYTIEQGKRYRYALQQYNDRKLYSNKVLSNIVLADFEDAFLYDGHRQLKIRFNPKVTSFKPNVLETKTNTIGSKYPFIFRNGQVYYREFPISGLISYEMDEENLFSDIYNQSLSLPRVEQGLFKESDVDTMSSKITKERDFKMDVLSWLTNGVPKLFRSPAEGNFIVRLMNVSLSPNDVLGRMLHTFNATAYEVAEYNYENLNNNDFIHLEDPEIESLRWETVEFFSRDTATGKVTPKTGVVNTHKAYTVKISDLYPGSYFYLVPGRVFSQSQMTEKNLEPYKIVVGATGSYYIESPVAIDQIIIPSPGYMQGSVTYSYYSILSNNFNKIKDVSVVEVPCAQYIGSHEIIHEIEYVRKGATWLKNPKIDIVEFYHLAASKRFVNNTTDTNHINPNIQDLYAVGTWQKVNQYNPARTEREFIINHYIDYANDKTTFPANEYDPCFYIHENTNKVSLDETENYYWERPGKITFLKSGNGTIVEVSYQIRITDFTIEDENSLVREAKQKYLNYQATLDNLLATKDNDKTITDQVLGEKITDAIYRTNAAYKAFILTLIDEQEKEREAEGL